MHYFDLRAVREAARVREGRRASALAGAWRPVRRQAGVQVPEERAGRAGVELEDLCRTILYDGVSCFRSLIIRCYLPTLDHAKSCPKAS